MRVIAHRGWSEMHPENSHAAFAAAVSAPCHGIEMDLRLSADGVVVVTHDADLSRFGGSRVPVARRTAADLGLPTLAEVLDRYRTVDLYLELKPHGGAGHTWSLVEGVCALVPTRRISILCFQAAVLAAVRQRRPDLRLVRNIERIPRDHRTFLARSREAGIAAVDCDVREWKASAVAAAIAIGIVPATYTVDRDADLEQCRAWGMAEVITNRPRWAWQALGLP